VRTIEYDLRARRPNRVGHAIGARAIDHSADAGVDVVVAHELRDFGFRHRLGVSSMRNTLCWGSVRALSKNIQRCGMKFRVTPLSDYTEGCSLP
jgi:hypothetical protein